MSPLAEEFTRRQARGWLNTPQAPEEASGTSGMKAPINGVPSFSPMDGWWLEGHLENFSGWFIGVEAPRGFECADDAHCLSGKLKK